MASLTGHIMLSEVLSEWVLNCFRESFKDLSEPSMDAIISVEMVGPLAGVLHQQVEIEYSERGDLNQVWLVYLHIICVKSIFFQAASSPSDFLAMIFGNRSYRDVKKASDSQSVNVVSTIKMQIKSWVFIDIRDVFDVKTKAFKKAEMKKFLCSREGVFLGFMRLRCPQSYFAYPQQQACAGKTGAGLSSPLIRISCSLML